MGSEVFVGGGGDGGSDVEVDDGDGDGDIATGELEGEVVGEVAFVVVEQLVLHVPKHVHKNATHTPPVQLVQATQLERLPHNMPNVGWHDLQYASHAVESLPTISHKFVT